MLLVRSHERAMARGFPSRFMPCTECGVSCERDALERHECELERVLDFRLFQLRDEIAAFDQQLRTYLASALGQFEIWYAARERRRRR